MEDEKLITLLTKSWWDYKEISLVCDVSRSKATEIKRLIIERYPNASNKYSNRLVRSSFVCKEFFGNTIEEQLNLVVKRLETKGILFYKERK